ncbi:MAG TPA: CDP-alcohol phosphatidyltransferase family protein, partial [Candidatus Saccharimonadales bacterium]|nr:CDP-alcohol phosphatidyltransferase family protein [Candidatus Saccharimonadales bacterium]
MRPIRQTTLYVGDALSILRALAVVPFALALMAEAWTPAFLILGLAWATDLVDGVAVRKWGGLSDRYPNLDLDGINDTILQIGSTGAITYYMGSQYGVGSRQFLTVGITATACAMWGGIMMLLIALKGETPVTRA